MKTSEWNGTPPGSDAAMEAGCKCPVLDNARGKGRFGIGEKAGWWISESCPLHFKSAAAPKTSDE